MFYWCIKYKITGFPPANRSWHFNGKPLIMNENVEDLESVWSAINPYGEEEGCLQIKSATHVNDGIYTLFASNSHGKTKKSIEAQFHRDIFSQTQITNYINPRQRPPPSTLVDNDELSNFGDDDSALLDEVSKVAAK
ncbi:High affinity nerve growth factor receptor-like protein [Leptotrombidium deliense]|uniref:High affinity nerve growth factor receptor-like protein n=1 Tax=Leptotrombidium deliense TaxID=299467 RepID=A0A443SKB8_9ACAR|nr:High affinity nerve growth factor receptor-like protein [Leptotrombidium deliense]